MRSVGSKKLFEYWDRLRGGRSAPERSEIEPSDIRELLGDTFILEINNSMKTICYRLAGTRLCSIYGRELKGYGYLGVWDETHNLSMIRCINRARSDYSPSVVSHNGTSESGRTASFETLLLPLLPTSNGSSRVMGICSIVEEAPFWLGTDPIVSNSVVKVRELPSSMSEANVSSMVPQIRDLSLNQRQADEPGVTQRAHLTVIKGGKTD